MASRKEVEATSRYGKAARRVFAALLLTGMLSAPTVCLARPGPPQANRSGHFGGNQHLGAWLQGHKNLSPDQQQKALEGEPGFNRLNPETQQKLLDRLHQINHMSPMQRQRTVDHIEAMERLSPQMRQQVRTSLQQYHTLPEDRQRLVKKAFRDLREYPPEQRAAMMRSSQFSAQFTPQERGILGNILAAEPYQPMHGPTPNNGVDYGR